MHIQSQKQKQICDLTLKNPPSLHVDGFQFEIFKLL